MKLVIIADYFAPENLIAAIRPTKIAKYIKINHPSTEIVVVTRKPQEILEDPILKSDLIYCNQVHRIQHSFFFRAIESLQQKIYAYQQKKKLQEIPKKKASAKPLPNRFYQISEIFRSWDYACKAKKFILKNINEIDIVLSTYGDHSTHWIAKKLKQKYPSTIWIADFRDPVFVPKLTAPFLFSFSKHYMDMVWKYSDYITAISRGCLEMLGDNAYQKPIQIIPNGFDIDDIKDCTLTTDPRILQITYVGSLYNGQRSCSPLWKAIISLINTGKISKAKICFHYAGKDSSFMRQELEIYGLSDILNDHGYVSRDESIKLQKSSNLLVVLSWNDSSNKGVLTGKFLEYLMMNKTILAIVSGNTPNSAIKQVVNETSTGFCFEEAIKNIDQQKKLEEFILNEYLKALSKKNLSQVYDKRNATAIEKYNYSSIAESFYAIMKNVQRKDT